MSQKQLQCRLVPKYIRRERCDRPEVELVLRTHHPIIGPREIILPFLVDTGSDVTTVPTDLATRNHIPFARNEPGSYETAAGVIRGYWGHLEIHLLDEWIK